MMSTWIFRNFVHTSRHVSNCKKIVSNWAILDLCFVGSPFYCSKSCSSFTVHILLNPRLLNTEGLQPYIATNLRRNMPSHIPCAYHAVLLRLTLAHLKYRIAARLGNSCHASSSSNVKDHIHQPEYSYPLPLFI